MNVKIFDTAGQEKYKALVKSYYNKADCVLLVYDISDKSSFLEVKDYYIQNIKNNCNPNIKVVLLGNKTDLEDKRQVPSEEGIDLALKNDYVFMETSCFKNTNVADAFTTLIENTNIEAKKNLQQNIINTSIQINNVQSNSEKSSCFC